CGSNNAASLRGNCARTSRSAADKLNHRPSPNRAATLPRVLDRQKPCIELVEVALVVARPVRHRRGTTEASEHRDDVLFGRGRYFVEGALGASTLRTGWFFISRFR